MIIQTYYSNRL